LASKSKKASKGAGSSASKAAPVRKKQPASAPSGAASRAKRAGKPGDGDKAKGVVKKRSAGDSKTSFAARSTGRVQALTTAAGKSQAEPDSKRRRQTADSLEAAKAAIDAALDKKALLPVLIDVSALASYTDFIGIVSGRSDRQVDAIAEGILASMKARGRSLLGQEGSGSGRWTLLDFGDVVVHVFYHPVREFYDLESLWVDAPRIQLRIPPEAVMAQPDALYGNL
jgi:ribosome-associated protein